MAEALELNKALGARLKSRRKSAHLDQAELATKIGLSRASISNIENGRQGVTLETLWRIASVLGVPLTALIPEEWETKRFEPRARVLTAAESEFLAATSGDPNGHS